MLDILQINERRKTIPRQRPRLRSFPLPLRHNFSDFDLNYLNYKTNKKQQQKAKTNNKISQGRKIFLNYFKFEINYESKQYQI